MTDKQREDLARLITELCMACWNHDKEEKNRLFSDCMDIVLPEDKEH